MSQTKPETTKDVTQVIVRETTKDVTQVIVRDFTRRRTSPFALIRVLDDTYHPWTLRMPGGRTARNTTEVRRCVRLIVRKCRKLEEFVAPFLLVAKDGCYPQWHGSPPQSGVWAMHYKTRWRFWFNGDGLSIFDEHMAKMSDRLLGG